MNFPPLWYGFQYELHQVAGIKWMLEREKDTSHQGGILCDEMGLGKTIQMIGLMIASPKKRNLFLGPLPVLEQWRETATKAGINCWTGTKDSRWEPPAHLKLHAPNLFLLNYEMAARKPSLTCEQSWDRVICDEAHRLANEGVSWHLVEQIPTLTHWFLTATPIVNKRGDLYALFKLLGVPCSDANIPLVVLARSMDQLRATMPHLPKAAIEKTHIIDFDTEDEGDFYRGVQGQIVRKFRALHSEGGATALDKLRLIMRLRQISLHPQIYIESRRKELGVALYNRPDWIDPSTKFQGIRDLIEKDGEPKKWIIFCHFHKEMELLKTFLSYSETINRIWLYSGKVTAEQRTKVLAETTQPIDGRHDILLIQLQSGGVGLNLQHFQSIIFSGPWWTAALMEQAVGRAVRIGQKSQVIVHHIVLKEEQGLNIDKHMRTKADAKGKMCDEALAAADHSIV
jgi:SNF2 family DNA or RNA helicase